MSDAKPDVFEVLRHAYNTACNEGSSDAYWDALNVAKAERNELRERVGALESEAHAKCREIARLRLRLIGMEKSLRAG